MVAALLPIALLGAAALAATGITYLGPPRPIQSPQTFFPLGGFQRMKGGPVTANPDLIFLGTLLPNDNSSVERWPVVKALDQFGTLTGVKAVDGTCGPVPRGPFAGQLACSDATFDWSNVRYTSRYLSFSHRDLLKQVDTKVTLYQRMTPTELALFQRYTKPYCGNRSASGCLFWMDITRVLPIVAIGDYVQLGVRLMSHGDLAVPLPTPTNAGSITDLGEGGETGLTFDQLRTALIAGKEPQPFMETEVDVNAEANVITALICHADSKRPASVCGRPTIKAILKSVK